MALSKNIAAPTAAGAGGAVTNKTLSSPGNGTVVIMARLLGSSSTFSLLPGSDVRFSIPNNTNTLVASGLIYTNQTLLAYVRETADTRAVEYKVTISGTVVAGTNLTTLSLAQSNVGELATAGTVVGAITGTTVGSTLSLTNSSGGRFAISGGNLVTGSTPLDYETATSHSITIRETSQVAVNSPLDTTLTVTVNNVFESPVLNALSLSATSFALGTPSSGQINGATIGSTISASGLPTGLSINGTARTWTYNGTGSIAASTIALTETLSDSANSPRVTTIGVAITVPVLNALALSSTTVVENTASGVTVAAFQNKTLGSTLSLTNDAGGRFVISGSNLLTGLVSTDYETATSHSVTVRESLAGVTNDTALTVSVTNVYEKANLTSLSLSSTTLTVGVSASGTISGATAGSTISASGLPTGMTINSAARTWAYDGTGTASTPTITLTETLGDSANSPRNTDIGLIISPSIFAISTPILFEGDSNTAWDYMNWPNWAKRALAKSDGRYYLPVGGDFAWAGATVASTSGAGSNSMEGRQAQVVAKITSLVSTFGRCVLYFQIGTNGTADTTGDIAVLATAVAAYKAAGARVYCNLAPEFYANSYRTALNAAIRNGTVPVDGYVDPTPLVVLAAGKTHYTENDNDAVGTAVANFLLGKITTNTIYSDTFAGFTIDPMSGSTGSVGTGGSGQLPTGWSSSRTSGDGTAVYSVSGPDANGLYTMQLALTGGASNTTFDITKSQALTFSLGDVVDGGATVAVISGTDESTILYGNISVGGGEFPKSANTAISTAHWAGPYVWRGYPINQAAGGSTITKRAKFTIAAGKTAVITVKGFFHCIRENSAAVAPVNTVAPVMNPVTVGSSPSCGNGTWTGTGTITYQQQFYLGETPIASSYVFQSGDLVQPVTCYVTATNNGGSTTRQSDIVTVGAQPVLSALTLSLTTATTGSLWTATLTGKTTSSTVAGTSSDGTTLTVSGTTISGTFSAAGTPTITLTETLAGASNTPRTSTPTVTVSAAAVTLVTLGISANTATAGTAWNVTISGKTSGSTISATSSDSTTLIVSGTTLSGTFSAAGTPTLTLTETLVGATNTPRATTVSVTVSAAITTPVWDTTLNFGTPSQLTYSNSNRMVAGNSNTNGTRYGRAGSSYGKSTGKWYFKTTLDFNNTGNRIGIGTSAIGGSTGGTNGTTTWHWTGTSAFTNSATQAMGASPAVQTGDYEVCYDLGAGLIWFRGPGQTNWNNSGSANPATGAGGLSISSAAGLTIYPICGIGATAANPSGWTFNTGTPPSGFAAL